MTFTNDQGFVAIQKRMLKERGLDLSQYKEKCLKRRIDVRLRATGAQTYLEYLAVLKRDPSECDRLLDDLTINVTKFIRDTETCKAIKDDVIPKIISVKQKQNKRIIRVWSAGCATGQEPYSIGILFNEILGRKISNFFISIYATDIDAFVKSRHSGENRSPDGLQLVEKTGFRLGRHPEPRSGTE